MVHEFPVIVYYEDTDMGGVVYYANYLRFIERARSTVVEEIGLDQNAMREEGIVFVVTRVEADYIAPARLGDRLTVRSTHYAQGPVRWVFDQEVVREGQVIFRAKVTAATMTLEGRPQKLPQKVRDLSA